MRVGSVYILLALGALASLGPSGLNPFNQMAEKGVLKLQLPVRAEQSHFDTISKRAYAASLVQMKWKSLTVIEMSLGSVGRVVLTMRTGP